MGTFVEAGATDAVQSSPVLIWVLIIVSAVLAVTTAVPKILGPIGQAWAEWVEGRRVRSVGRDDADIAERDRIIAYQAGVIDEQRWEIQERNRLIRIHEQFDYEWIGRLKPPLTREIPALYPQKRPSPAEVAANATEGENHV